MSAAVHTPGPWTVMRIEPARPSIMSSSGLVAKVARQADDDTTDATAAVLAAAPLMLEALRVAREFISIDRASAADCITAPDGSRDPDDQAILDDYDGALSQIDKAIQAATK